MRKWVVGVEVVGMVLLAVARPVFAGSNRLPWYYFLGNLKIGPFPSQRMCRDDLGSCHQEHGPKCLTNPVGDNCKGIGPGFGVINGLDLCSNDCVSEGYAKGFYFVVVERDGKLSLAGPYSKHPCEQLSDECLSIGVSPTAKAHAGDHDHARETQRASRDSLHCVRE
jgi:hypothetical protein